MGCYCMSNVCATTNTQQQNPHVIILTNYPPQTSDYFLPPYNLSPTRMKRFTYVDKTTFVSKKLLQILGYSERAH